MHDVDTGEWYAESIRNQLGKGGFVALTMAMRAGENLDGANGIHPHFRRFPEADTGTEGLGAFSPKVDATMALWNAGERCWGAAPGTWIPAVFAPSAGRAKSLAKAIVERGGGDLWFVAETARVREVGFFGPVFATAAEVAATARGDAIAYRGALMPSRDGVAR